MVELIDDAILYVLRLGPSSYRTDPDLGPDARGVCNRIKTLSKRIEDSPILAIKLWNKYEAQLEGLPMVKTWWAFKSFHLDDSFNRLYDSWLE